ncbi:MAG: SMP-30/gluconolactonase/LRE family protein [Candidatus Omnitrophica bacterium]|nr:SMP-30/gluconolactonase/LRE family protein [Candidatus Omnitrophota bacterium]
MSWISAALAFALSNFETPESVAVDPEDGSYYVSNVNGEPLAKDGNGYISKINAEGSVVIQKFIGGKDASLNAPKGILVSGKNIFVTDIHAVKGFDKATGKITALVDLSRFGVRFLNDIAAEPSGAMFVSDTMTNRIFRIDPSNHYEAKLFYGGKELGSPNGLAVNPKNRHLLVATWGSGEVLEIDRWKKIHVLKRGLQNLDGIDVDNRGNLYVSAFERGEVYRISNLGRGALVTALSGLVTPADISYDRKKDELLVPSFKGHTVSSVSQKTQAG